MICGLGFKYDGIRSVPGWRPDAARRPLPAPTIVIGRHRNIVQIALKRVTRPVALWPANPKPEMDCRGRCGTRRSIRATADAVRTGAPGVVPARLLPPQSSPLEYASTP